MISLKRQARLRREYLYRRALEIAAAGAETSRQRGPPGLARPGGASSTPSARRDTSDADEKVQITEEALRHPIRMLATTRLMLDDEYATAGVADPKIVITTSRNPSSRLCQFAKEVRFLFPNAQRMNRGNLILKDLIELGRAQQLTDLVLLHETRGEPDALIVCHLPLGPTAYFALSNVVMRHDVAEMLRHEHQNSPDAALPPLSEAYPHVIFEGSFQSRLGMRVKNMLRFLFPVPKPDSKRIVAFIDKGYDGILSFRHYIVERRRTAAADDSSDDEEAGTATASSSAGRIQGHQQHQALIELGPRFDLGLFRIRLGTLEQQDADDEWRLAPYTRSARKRRRLFG